MGPASEWEPDGVPDDWEDADAWRGGEPPLAGDEWKCAWPEDLAGPEYRLYKRDAEGDDGCA